MKQNGIHLTATVADKLKVSSESGATQDNQITISFAHPAGKMQTVNTSSYISKEEYDALEIGQSIEVLYNPTNEQVYYSISFNRYLNDQWFMYFFPALLFVVGAMAGIAFRNHKVGVHEDTGDEYLEKTEPFIFMKRIIKQPVS